MPWPTLFSKLLKILKLSPEAFAMRSSSFDEGQKKEKIKNVARGTSTMSRDLAATLANEYGVEASCLLEKKGECVMFDRLPAIEDSIKSWKKSN